MGKQNKSFNLTFVLSRNLLNASRSSRRFRANFCLRQKPQTQVKLIMGSSVGSAQHHKLKEKGEAKGTIVIERGKL